MTCSGESFAFSSKNPALRALSAIASTTACSMDTPRFWATLDARTSASPVSSIVVLMVVFSPYLEAKSRARGHSNSTGGEHGAGWLSSPDLPNDHAQGCAHAANARLPALGFVFGRVSEFAGMLRTKPIAVPRKAFPN